MSDDSAAIMPRAPPRLTCAMMSSSVASPPMYENSAFGYLSAISRSSASFMSTATTAAPVVSSSSITLRPVEPAPHTMM